MPKSSRPSMFGRGGGTVTVIEQPVMRSYLRKAKIVFAVIWVAVGLLAATVLASVLRHHYGPVGGSVLALVLGAVIGLMTAALIASIVAAWPVIRVIWWWLPELVLAFGLIIGWIELAAYTDLVMRLIAVTLIVGVPAGIGPVRRKLSALSWCLISRHRVRNCFNEFIITNRTGSLPLMLAARPTPAGERLWVFLRPGLCLDDIIERSEKLAAGCWASAVIADQASASNSALVRIDIKRRDPLTGTVASPLNTLFSAIIPGRKPVPVLAPQALDLTDVQPGDVTTPAKNGTAANSSRPQWPGKPARNDAESVSDDADDTADWI
jgi:hypothetical protein